MSPWRIALALALVILASPAAAQTTAAPNPFAGFETFFLPNGLKVWFKRLPDDPSVSVSLAVPYGSDRDPAGKEQLAHFTEHMLFSDHLGRTEEQIKREIEDIGGVRNGFTTWDRTFYFARVGKQHGMLALDWLYRILSPHEMPVEVVDRQREPVALEVGARPRQFFDWLYALYLNPPALRPADFWEREFGLLTSARRDIYAYRSLHQITRLDLRGFYDRYYVPARMTLTVIGDFDRDAVFHQVNETFATLPSRPAPPDAHAYADPNRADRVARWTSRSDVYLQDRFKLFGLTREQDLHLIFLSRFLAKRLNTRLRFGERKATYGISAFVSRRGPLAYLEINGGIKEAELTFARATVEEELDALRNRSLPPGEFDTTAAAVASELRTTNTTSRDLENWVWSAFYDPDRYRDFPDLVAFAESVELDDVAAFVREHFVPARRYRLAAHPFPISQGALAVLGLFVVWGTGRLARRLLTSSVDMTRIRYVARFRVPFLYAIVAGTMLAAAAAVVLRLLMFFYQWATLRFLVSIDSFWLQFAVYGFMLASVILLAVLALSCVPRKLLVFDDRLLVKFLAYRSTPIPVGEVAEVRTGWFRDVWLSRRVWRSLPLTLGLLRPGIYLRTKAGRGYFFRVRKPDELIGILHAPGTPLPG